MKTRTSKRIAAVTLALLAAAQLAGCNSDDSPSTSAPVGTGDKSGDDPVVKVETVSVSGKAADGYLVGANVCLDLNSNMKCDTDEPKATTGTNGAFTLAVPTSVAAASFPIVVEVSATTVDEDTGLAVDKPFVLSAPAGESSFISPMTTVVHGMLQQNPSLTREEVETQVKLSIGASAAVDLFEDYVAAKAETGDTAAEYERLHLIAQVAAKVMATNQEAILAAASTQGVDTTASNAALLALVTNQVIDNLQGVALAVDEAGEDFDISSIEPDAATFTDLTQQIKDAKTVASAAKSTMESVLAEGLYWIWAEAGDGDRGDEIEYGYFKKSDVAADRLQETGSDYVAGNWVASEPDAATSFLTATGWKDVVDTGANYAISYLDDGTAKLTLDGTNFSMKFSAAEVVVSGKAIKDSLGYYGHELALPSIAGDPVFSSGAKIYQTNMITLVDTYTIDTWDGCELQYADPDGDCNVVLGPRSAGKPATGLEQLLYGKDEPKTGPAIFVGDGIQLRLVTGGSNVPNGSILITDAQAENQVSEGSWAIKTVTLDDGSTVKLVMLTLPERFTPRLYDAGKPFLALKGGYSRRGVLTPAGSADMLGEPQFNAIAFKDIQDNSDVF